MDGVAKMDQLTVDRAARLRPLHLIGVAEGRGAADRGCRDGPDALLAGGLADKLKAAGVPATWRDIVAAEGRSEVESIGRVCERLADRVSSSLRAGAAVTVIGGDHSCAVGTWNGVHAHLRPRGPLGLVWVDAHMDSHIPATSPSGRLHGMPLAHLFGYGEGRLTELGVVGPVLRPEHVALVGVRSWEKGEAELLTRLGVRVMLIEEVRRRGLSAAMDEAVAIARRGTAGFGLSIDLDAVDPGEAPGVGSPVAGGLVGRDLVAACTEVARLDGLVASEVVEYNPHRDPDGVTAHLVGALVAACYPGESQR